MKHGPSQAALPFQKQLWLMQKMAPRSGVANISARLNWHGPLDLHAMQTATFDFVDRHAYLKCSLQVDEQGELVQIQENAAPAEISITDIQHLPKEKKQAAVANMLSKATESPLDLNTFPLIRCVVVRSSVDLYDIAFVFNHLTCDGLSMGILCREFLKAYEARLKKQIPTWHQPVPSRLNDQTSISHQKLAQPTSEAKLALPYDRPPKPNPKYLGDRISFEMTDEQSGILNELSRRFEVSPFVTWLSLIQTVLFRYTNEPQAKIDIVRSGRTSEQRRIVGPFFETTEVQLNTTGNNSFQSLLTENQSRLNDLNSYRPRELSLSNSRSQVLVDYQSSLPITKLANGVTVIPSEWDNGAATAELCIGIRRNKKQFSGHIKYDIELFDRETIDRMIDHVKTMLNDVSVAPEKKINELKLITNYELEVYRATNETARTDPAPLPVDQQFFEAAAASPDATALVFEGNSITYSRLRDKTLSIANRLKSANVSRGDRVGLLLERSPDCIASMLAVMVLGAAYVPLNPKWPLLQRNLVAKKAGVTCIITNKINDCEIDVAASFLNVQIAPDDKTNTEITFAGQINHQLTDTAYILFTSGSTGEPKGVEVSHANVSNFFVGMDALQTTNTPGCWLAVTNPTFDISVFELLWTLARGYKVVLHPNENLAAGFANAVLDNQATHFQCTPALMQLLLSDKQNRDALCRLKHIYVGGDVMSQALADELARFPKTTVFNMYGPTETTIWSTAWKIEAGMPVRIGKPLANQRVHVIDESQSPAPIGIAGQLFISGQGVSKGYLNAPTETANSFIDHDQFGRLYRTGDIVKMDSNGNLEFIGRNDNQVKLLGHRFELGAIESVILQDNNIENCVVYLEGKLQEKRLFAKYHCKPNCNVTKEQLRIRLCDQLPPYMIPVDFIALSQMPINSSGKIDRTAVISMQPIYPHEPINEAVVHDLFVDQEFNQLTEIIRDQLRIDELPMNANWTDLEISSLDVVGMVVKIERELGLSVPVSDLFQRKSIKETLNTIMGIQSKSSAPSSYRRSQIANEIEEGVI